MNNMKFRKFFKDLKYSLPHKRFLILMGLLMLFLVVLLAAISLIRPFTREELFIQRLREHNRITDIYQKEIAKKLHIVTHPNGLECAIWQPNGITCNWTNFNKEK